MKKLKETYEFIKEKLEDTRTRSATILGLYAIFFFLLFLLLSTGTGNNVEKANTNNLEEIINYSNIQKEYEYTYNLEIREIDKITKYLITGKESIEEKNNLVKIYNDVSQDYVIDNSSEKLYDEEFINLNKIISLVNDIDYEYTTEYKNGDILKNYLVPLNKINYLYDLKENIEISIYEYDNFINKIVIDLTNYEIKNNNNIESVIYTLEYKNI
ncbi:MAG: hypothetical protein IJO32_05730 [Bacilli bacterium]|nr:hypothetical protein [Bacilli bacterium]